MSIDSDKRIKAVKVILPGSKCPHCDKDIVIAAAMTTPFVEWVLRPEDIEGVKNKIKKYLDGMTVSKEQRDKLESWLNDPETQIAPEELDDMLESLSSMLEPEK